MSVRDVRHWFKLGFDTVAIARLLNRTEAEIYNVLARGER